MILLESGVWDALTLQFDMIFFVDFSRQRTAQFTS